MFQADVVSWRALRGVTVASRGCASPLKNEPQRLCVCVKVILTEVSQQLPARENSTSPAAPLPCPGTSTMPGDTGRDAVFSYPTLGLSKPEEIPMGDV